MGKPGNSGILRLLRYPPLPPAEGNKRRDWYWQQQDIIYDFRAQIKGTRCRTEISRVHIV